MHSFNLIHAFLICWNMLSFPSICNGFMRQRPLHYYRCNNRLLSKSFSSTMKSGKTLVITESSTKSKTIEKILNNISSSSSGGPGGYIVKTCPENIRELVSSFPPLFIRSTINSRKNNNFTLNMTSALNIFNSKYETSKSNVIKQLVSDLQSDLSTCSRLAVVFNADDSGDLLAWNLLSALSVPQNVSIHRVKLTELSPAAVNFSFSEINSSLSSFPTTERHQDNNTNYENKNVTSSNLLSPVIQSRVAQRVADRAVAVALSQALHQSLGDYYSAGRVLTNALNLLVEHERLREMRLKKQMPSYSIKAKFSMQPLGDDYFPYAYVSAVNNLPAPRPEPIHLAGDNNKLLLHENMSSSISKLCNSPSTRFCLSSVESSDECDPPPAPLNTPRLLALCSARLGFTPSKTLELANSLYEKGFITYPHTSSNSFSEKERDVIRGDAIRKFGKEFVDLSSLEQGTGGTQSSGRLGAVRPVISQGRLLSSGGSGLQGQELRVYDLIHSNTLASCMLPAQRRCHVARIEALSNSSSEKGSASCDLQNCTFQSLKRELLFPGYLVAFLPDLAGRWHQSTFHNNNNNIKLQQLIGSEVKMLSSTFSDAKINFKILRNFDSFKRMTPTQLLVRLSESGSIGEDVPFASLRTLDHLAEKGYIAISSFSSANRTDSPKACPEREDEVVPTKKGLFIIDYLKRHFSFLVDPMFSPTLKQCYDQIANQRKYEQNYFLYDFLFGSNHSFINNSSLNYLFKDGLFRNIAQHLNAIKALEINSQISKVVSRTKEDIGSLVSSQYIGLHPSTKEPLFFSVGKYGNYLQVGTKRDNKSALKRYPLPSWLTAISLKNGSEMLEFTSLPKTLFMHPSIHEPVIIYMRNGSLWIKLGNDPFTKTKIRLEAGILPSQVTKAMALKKLSYKIH